MTTGRHTHSANKGFTLIETLISLALIGLLMGIALPSLELQWQKTRRQDAQNTLLQLHLRQLQWRGLYPQYANALSELGWPNLESTSGYYSLRLQNVSAQGYVLEATAIGLQSRDTPCASMTLRVSENAAVLRTSNAFLLGDPSRCWKW